MQKQAEFQFPATPEPPAPDLDEVAAFVQFLRDHGDWIRRSQIEAEFPAWNERQCRLLAAHSDGHIISSGKGYKTTLQALPLEFDAFERRLSSQVKSMTARLIDARRVWHSKGLSNSPNRWLAP